MVVHLALSAHAFPWAEHALDATRDASAVAARGGPAFALTVPGGTRWYDGVASAPIDAAPEAASVTLVDLDGDGIDDLLLPDGFVLADGLGGWTARSPLPWAWERRVGDLDGDGDPDLVGPEGWVENEGSGRFGRTRAFAEAGESVVGLADTDADGDLDLVVTWVDGSTVVGVRANDGAGGFSDRAAVFDVASGAALGTGDADHDGRADVLLARAGDVRFRPGRRDGGFGGEVVLAAGALAAAWELVDVDGDGLGDFVSLGATVEVRLWDGAAYGAPDVLPALSVAAFATGDLDGDADTDVIAVPGDSGGYFAFAASWLENPGYADADGDGLSDAAEVALGTDPQAADTDADGLSDLAERARWGTDPLDAGDAGDADLDGDGLDGDAEARAGADPTRGDTDGDGAWDRLERALGLDPRVPDTDGDGFLDGEEARCGSDPADPTSIDPDCDGLDGAAERAAATDPDVPDTDLDGLLDGAELAEHGTDPLDPDTDGGEVADGAEVARGSDPRSRFDDWPARAPLALGAGGAVGVGDLDGDGDVDLAVALGFGRVAGTQAAWLEWTGAGHVVHDLEDLGPVRDLTVADVDGDGVDDLFFHDGAEVRTALGPDFASSVPLFGYTNGLPLAVDLDGDGDLDAVGNDRSEFGVWEDVGGAFAFRPWPAFGTMDRAVASDVDADGDLDVVAVSIDGGSAGWWENLGGLAAADHWLGSGGGDLLAAGDLDADGDVDVVSGGRSTFVFPATVHEAVAPGRFAIQVLSGGLDADLAALATGGDLDGDGAEDLAFARADGLVGFTSLAGSRAARPGRLVELERGGAAALAVVDVDGDGDADVVATGGAAPGLRWFENLAGCFADADGDGFGGAEVACAAGVARRGGDCDDADPDARPGSPEWCDGADNDCDGVADEGAVAREWHADADGDGFGDPAVVVSTCERPPDGLVEDAADCDDGAASTFPTSVEVACNGADDDCVAGTPDLVDRDYDGAHCLEDCDDANAERFPGGRERCDGLDNDCDGVVDPPGTATAWYVDGDGDGVGAGEPVEACEPPDGRVDRSGDCDDGDPLFVTWCPTGSVTRPGAAPVAGGGGGGGCGCDGAAAPAAGWAGLLAALLRRRPTRRAPVRRWGGRRGATP